MRIEQLTFTRFLAAMSIVVFHYGLDLAPFNKESISYLFEQANVGVSYFFILSGFVMIIAYGRKEKINTPQYLQNRFARIYPVYFLAILILFVFKAFIQNDVDYSGMVLNVFMLQSWIPMKALSFNVPAWSLVVEFLFYFLFPLLFNRVYSKRNYLNLVVPIVSFWLISQFAFHWALRSSYYEGPMTALHNFLYYFPFMHLNEFLIGNLAGLFMIHRWKDKKWNTDLLILALFIITALLLKYDTGLNFHNGLFALTFVPLIVLISMNNGWFTKLSNIKQLVFLGEISYGIYILQRPIHFWTQRTLTYLGLEHGSPEIFYIYLLVLIAASAISYQFIETPLRQKIKKWNAN